MKSIRSNDFVSLLVLVVAIGIGIGMTYFPHIADDLKFMTPFADYIKGESDNLCESFKNGFKFWLNNDNLRISNLLAIYLLWLPSIVTGTLTTIAVWVIMRESIRLANICSKPLLSSCFILSFLIIYPWCDQLYLADFQINYIWPTAISLWILRKVLDYSSDKTILVALMCFLLGLMHEGFAVGIEALFLLLILVSKKYRILRYYIFFVCIIPGLLTISFGQLNSFNGLYFIGRMNILYIYSLPFVSFVLLTLFRSQWLKCLFLKNYVCKSLDLKLLALLCLGATGTFLMLIIPTGPRSGALGIISSLIGIFYLIGKIHLTNGNLLYLRRVTTICVVCVIFLHLYLVDKECIHANRYTTQVITEYKANSNDPIFVDMTLRANINPLCFQKPYYDWFAHKNSVKVFENFYKDKHSSQLRVVPKQLKNIDFEKLEKIEGTANLYFYNYLIIGKAELPEPYINNLEIIEDGLAKRVKYFVVPFDKEKQLAWYYPNQTDLSLFPYKSLIINQ